MSYIYILIIFRIFRSTQSTTLSRFALLFFLLTVNAIPLRAAEYQPGERLPVEFFASLPETSQVALSPSGKRIAAVHNIKGTTLVVTRPPSEVDYVALLKSDNPGVRINWIRWVNEDWLLLSGRFPSERDLVPTLETRLLSLKADGSKTRWLVLRGNGNFQPQLQDKVIDILPDDPDHILVALDRDNRNLTGVHRVDIRTGNEKTVVKGIHNAYNWITDQQHQVRVGERLDGTHVSVLVKPAGARRFQTLWEYELFSGDEVVPLGFGLDPDQLYIQAYHKGHLAVFTVNLADPDLPRELILSNPERDITGRLLHAPSSGDAVGIVTDDGQMTLWDPAYAAFYRGLQSAFPGQDTYLLDMSRDEQIYLILVSGDRNPGTYYVGDRRTGLISPVANRYPQLTEELISGHHIVHYQARDATPIEAFLTLPIGVEPEQLPAVVFPHGGPIANDNLGFDYWSEFFANRGYAVLQMNFRGSFGYGIDFLRAGLQNWGREMQDDVEDAAHWLVAQGIADPDRMCIVGGSYGGYAALMAAARSPEVFRCAISFAGVTDLVSLVRGSRRYANNEVIEEMIGNSYRDLAARSPVNLAADVKLPILLVHGTADRVVDISQGRSMHQALEKAEKWHVYTEQQDGDHHLSSETQRLELFTAMEEFLARYLD